MSEWKECRLGEVAELINGFAFKSTEFSDVGIPVIKIKNVASGKLLLDEVQYYPFEITHRLEPFVLKKDDILIAMTGSHVHQISSIVGKVTRYDRPFIALLNQRVGKIVARGPDVLNEDYIYYFLRQDDVTIDLATNAGGSANQANISSEQIRNLPVYLPSISEQTAIAGVLSSLDDKIDLLHRQNRTLEGMADALFRGWFEEYEENSKSTDVVERVHLGEVIETVSKTHSLNTGQIIFLNTSDIYGGTVLRNEFELVKGLPGQAKKSIQRGGTFSLVK